MKTRISILLILIVVGLLTVSCNDFLDVNSDPNNPSEVEPDLVLPTGLNYTAEYVQEAESPDRSLNILGNLMMFTFGESQGFNWYREEFKYELAPDYDRLFDFAYSRALKQYKILSNLDDSGYYKSIGMIMEAYHFQILVDLYGDVPYSEALERGQTPTPKYDKPETIYKDLLNRLSTAISIIDSTAQTGSAAKVGNGDTIFNGDMSKWKQFANSLKIRILTRYSDVGDSQFINDELAKIQNSGAGYIEKDVEINPGYEKEEEDRQNPYWDDLGKNASGTKTLSYKATCATQFVVDYFTGTNDTTRFNRIFESPGSGPKGIDQGQPNDDAATQAPDKVSNLKLGGGVLKSATMGSVIMTLAEHKLNMAELAQKNLNVSSNAKDYYKEGVRASFSYLGAPDSAATAYLSQNKENTAWSVSSNKMDAIMTQKWIATMGINAEQAWFDYNRTGYPDGQPVGATNPPTGPTGFPISAKAGSNNDRPVRLKYPQSELTRNSANVPEQPNVFTDKIFWAK